MFYFEAKVMDAGRFGYIVVGVCSDQADLEQLPGWGTDTWGYHGDDGRAFDGNSGNEQGLPFGPRYTALDVIGCGIDMQRRDIFFTKNGRFIGKAFCNIRFGIDLYPCIGLNSPGESMIVNFGSQPFEFDIEKYIKVKKKGSMMVMVNVIEYDNRINKQTRFKNYNKSTCEQVYFAIAFHNFPANPPPPPPLDDANDKGGAVSMGVVCCAG